VGAGECDVKDVVALLTFEGGKSTSGGEFETNCVLLETDIFYGPGRKKRGPDGQTEE